METIFKYIQNKLETIPQLRWIDLDNGAINNFTVRPAIDFPAALITIEYPQTANVKRKTQKCNVSITIRLVFDYTPQTDNTTPDQDFSHLRLAEEVYSVLQGEIDTAVFNAPLERVGHREQNRPDNIKVISLLFQTWKLDEKAEK